MIEITKNASEIIRIDRHEYRGEDIIDLRVWVNGDKLGEMIPTRKGITFRTEIVTEVIMGLEREMGWNEDPEPANGGNGEGELPGE